METRERQIGELTFKVTQFGARQGLAVLTRLMKLVGPGLQAATTGDEGQAIAKLITSLEPNEVLGLAEEFASKTTIRRLAQTAAGPQWVDAGGLATQFDEVFADKYDELIEFLVFAVVVNFERSLKRGKALGGRLTELAASLSPSTSTGSGNASSQAGGTA